MRTLTGSVGISLTAISLFLLLSQVVGLFRAPASFPSAGDIPGFNVPTRDLGELQELLNRREENPSFAWLIETNEMTFGAIPHGNHSMLRFEHSWVLWLLSKWKGDSLRATQNAKMVAMSGGAICSQAARLVQEIARHSGVPARLVSLDGHVIVELMIDNAWYVADPDFGVVFAFDATALSLPENEPEIREALSRKHYPETLIETYLSVIHNGFTHRHPVYEAHEPKPWLIEKWSVMLSWMAPFFGLFVGLFLVKNGRAD